MSTQEGVVNAAADTGNTIFNSLSGFFNSIQEGVGQYGLKIVGGIVALIIGLWIVKMIMRAVTKAFDKSKVDQTLKPFLVTSNWLLHQTVGSVKGILCIHSTLESSAKAKFPLISV